MEIPKLITVTRTDIPEGYQAVQSAHAAIDFVFEHPTRAGPWHKNSNTLVMLTVKDVGGLKHLIRKCEYLKLSYTAFHEPDLDNELTAICIEPHPETYKMVSKLPLLIPETNEQDNNGDQMSPGKSHQENSLQEEMGEDNTGRKGEDFTRDFHPESPDALGTELLPR